MNRSAQHGHQWVWTELTESLRGVRYPATEERKAGTPIPAFYGTTVPLLWVEKGYVREAMVDGQMDLFDIIRA